MLVCTECLFCPVSGHIIDQLPAIIQSGVLAHSNTLKYSSNRYTLPPAGADL